MSARKFCSLSLATATLFAVAAFSLLPRDTGAADDPQEVPPAIPPAAETGGSEVKLAAEQAKLSEKFKELERVLLRMAEVTQANDPKRAAVLRQVFAKSKERQVALQFEDIVKLLENEQLYQANKGQVAVQQDLTRLLELLLTGDRDKQIPSERAEIKKFIERINRIIRSEQGLQGRTEGQGDPVELAKQQENIAKTTKEPEAELKKFDDRNKPINPDGASEDGERDADGNPKSSDGKSAKNEGDKKSDDAADKEGDKESDDDKKSDGKNGDPKSDDKKSDNKKSDEKKANEKADSKKQDSEEEDGIKENSDAEKSDDKKSDDSDAKPSDSKIPSKSSKSQQQSQQQQQQSEPSESDGDSQQQQDQQQNQDESQARRKVREAQERMQEAKRRLEEAKRRGASEEQQKAIDALQQAKAELEEILRQLREEEIERTLAMLEARFRKMLQMQIEVYEGTVRLDRVPEDQRDRDIEIESAKLGRREAEITAEADKTLNLLREEGSSAAFPEAVDQMREDMENVTERLARANVGQLTQGVEQDIVKALEEMIAALQKAQRDAQRRRNGGGGGGGGGGDQDQDLVDQIAELKMIRALQMRVNTRTQRYTRLLEEGIEQAIEPDLIEAIRKLSEREERIYKTTRDIVVGRNK